MNVTINGEIRTFDGPLTVAGLLETLQLPLAGIAVERNREIVKVEDFAQTELADGDELEIVTLVGGG